MSDDTNSPKDGENEDRESDTSKAGFRIDTRWFKVWGGPKELREWKPIFHWLLIIGGLMLVIREIVGLLR